MIFNITSQGGHICIGNWSLLWENATNEFPGFTAIANSDYSLEFGEIDNGNGIFLTKYGYGDIEFTKPILKL